VRPVYPMTSAPPDPLAQRFCEAIHELPAKRKAECCKSSPGFTVIEQCTRTLSFALREKAVTLAPTDVDKCAEAMAKSVEGCDWVAPLPPYVPAACDGIIRGTLVEGTRCRASLECADNLRCLGAGPTEPGRCSKPLPRGGPCSHAVDTLAAYTAQSSSDARHPECAGYCAKRWCADAVPVGGACESTTECGPERYCVSGHCAEGSLPAAGQPCLAGLCAKGDRCVKGKCLAAGAIGDRCDNDTDCRSGCEKPASGGAGKCFMKCWAK